MAATSSERRRTAIGIAIALFLLTSATARGQGQAAQPRASDPSPRELAPIDLTGYWVSVVTEDWRYRMVMPLKGDYGSVPLNAEGRRVADTWRPDQAGRCEAFGAGAVMRAPGAAAHHLGRRQHAADRHRGRQCRRGGSARSDRGRAVSCGRSVVAGHVGGQLGRPARRDRRAADRRLRPPRQRHGRCGAADGVDAAQGGDDEPARRLAARQRRALQRAGRDHRALHALRGAGRRGVAHGPDGRGRSAPIWCSRS